MPENDVADSTDWLSTSLPALARVEASLRCQVCKDFYETPMITTCSHTFCSLCIRRALSNDSKCPVCRAGEQEVKLRSNWSVEEAVESFKAARSAVLELAQRKPDPPPPRSPKRKTRDGEDGSQPEPAPDAKRLRSSARLSRNKQPVSYAVAPEVEEEEVVPASDAEEDEFVPEPDDGLVACPMCQKRMKEWQVFGHIESCTGPSPKRQNTNTDRTTQLGATGRIHNTTYERLPGLSYGLFKENALRKKLGDLKIPNHGPRQILEKRHREWVTLWNANCDAARPKNRMQLLQELDTWEKTQGSRAPTTGRAAQNAALIKDKDFDGAAWATRHNDSFQDLIANARKSRMETKQKPKTDESPEAPPPKDSIPQETPEAVIGVTPSSVHIQTLDTNEDKLPTGSGGIPGLIEGSNSTSTSILVPNVQQVSEYSSGETNS
uniref:Postreplication repair E3 ubiquitin-protein ligase RAD18 n=1 Tax=Bionectria ochroleuca TaxID=29856 RepID=A0A8H7N6R0_BIOOC